MRPEYISKLCLYLIDKEPLIYLFIINSDFIENKKVNILPPGSPAGVTYRNRRVVFIYDDDMLSKMPVEELYFIILHEAFHIFKRHHRRTEKNLSNHLLANIAQDMVINEEIKSTNYYYDLVPKSPEYVAQIPNNFKKEHEKLKEDAYVSERIYYWLLNQKIEKKDLLKPGSFVRIKDTDIYGQIKEENRNGTYKVEEMSLEEMKEKICKKNSNKGGGKINNYKEEELIPVVWGEQAGDGEGIEVDFDVETIGQIDKHLEETNEQDKVDVETFAKKIVKKAQNLEEKMVKIAGQGKNNLLSKVESLLKPKINWKKELNRRLNLFYSDNCGEKGKKKSIINYPWNPKSRYGILCKHFIETTIKKQSYVIFAIDTSGSCFFDKHEIQTFFTEIDSLSKEFAFSKKGKIFTIQWDWEVSEGLSSYKKNDWKRFKLKGGGGTDPRCVFKYIDKIYKKQNGWYVINENGNKFIITDKKKLPLLVFLTDGYFFKNLSKKDLGVYENNEKNVVYFAKKTDMIYPKENYIKYIK